MSDLIYNDGIRRIRASNDQAPSQVHPPTKVDRFGKEILPTLDEWRTLMAPARPATTADETPNTPQVTPE